MKQKSFNFDSFGDSIDLASDGMKASRLKMKNVDSIQMFSNDSGSEAASPLTWT